LGKGRGKVKDRKGEKSGEGQEGERDQEDNGGGLQRKKTRLHV